ncbi:MAG: SRPBCC family protein [Kordiimonas sp.]
MGNAEFYYVTLIDAPRDTVWRALTNGEFTKQYWHMTEVKSDWVVGSKVVFLVDGEVGCEGEVLVADAPRSLSYTWHFPRNPVCAAEAPSRVLFSLEEIQGVTKLTVKHDRFSSEDSPTYKMVSPGWPFVLAGLKTLCETGKTFDFSMLEKA